MRVLGIIVVLAVAGWGGYWYLGKSAYQAGLEQWFEDRRTEGWVADYAALETGGFPSRFDTEITSLELADPETGVAWQAPLFRVEAASASPTEIDVVWPGEQTIASPQERVTILSEVMRAGVRFAPNTSLALEAMDATLDQVVLRSSEGWESAVQSGIFTTRLDEGSTTAHVINFTATGVTPGAQIVDIIDTSDILPDALETLQLDMTADFDAPWDRAAIEERRPQPTALDLRLAKAQWGPLELSAVGAVTVDADGRPEGSIDIKATEWREMLRMAVAGGVIPADLAPTIERGLQLLAGLSGSSTSLNTTLNFNRGLMSVGPIPVGPAPVLRLR
ncbi:MAG: DUF2125 domain-containing protein [Pseudomonadota bacterium]